MSIMSQLHRATVLRQSRLSDTMRFRVYNLRNSEGALQTRRYEFVRKDKVVRLPELLAINHRPNKPAKTRRWYTGHVRRMDQAAAAHPALYLTTQ